MKFGQVFHELPGLAREGSIEKARMEACDDERAAWAWFILELLKIWKPIFIVWDSGCELDDIFPHLSITNNRRRPTNWSWRILHNPWKNSRWESIVKIEYDASEQGETENNNQKGPEAFPTLTRGEADVVESMSRCP